MRRFADGNASKRAPDLGQRWALVRDLCDDVFPRAGIMRNCDVSGTSFPQLRAQVGRKQEGITFGEDKQVKCYFSGGWHRAVCFAAIVFSGASAAQATAVLQQNFSGAAPDTHGTGAIPRANFIVTGGVPNIAGESVLSRRLWASMRSIRDGRAPRRG
jgi:hypothetical protein